MMKFICTISVLLIAFSVVGCDVQPVPRQPGETPAQPGVVQEPIALPQDAPQAQDYYQQQGTAYPPQQQQQMVYPQQQGMVYPQQQGMVYPQQQGMVYPQQPGTAYQQPQLPVSQEAIELPLGVEPKPGMEIIQEPGQAPRLVYQDGTPVSGQGQVPQQAYPQQAYPQQAYPQQGQPAYGPPVTSGPPAVSNQPRIQETPDTQGLQPGMIYQQGPNGQLVPVPPDTPNTSYQQYPQYPQQQQYPQQGQVFYPPQQGATMQKRDPSGQLMNQGNNGGYYSQPYGAPQQGMVGQQPYYPPQQPSAN